MSLELKGNVWIFQANPKRFDLIGAFNDPEVLTGWAKGGDNDGWEINQHKDEIHTGDVAIIWMSGLKAGIYGLAEVISEPEIFKDSPEGTKYWINPIDRNKSKLRVHTRLRKNFVSCPIFRHELKCIPALKNLSIFRFAQGTNFLVTQEEWSIIKDKIQG